MSIPLNYKDSSLLENIGGTCNGRVYVHVPRGKFSVGKGLGFVILSPAARGKKVAKCRRNKNGIPSKNKCACRTSPEGEGGRWRGKNESEGSQHPVAVTGPADLNEFWRDRLKTLQKPYTPTTKAWNGTAELIDILAGELLKIYVYPCRKGVGCTLKNGR